MLRHWAGTAMAVAGVWLIWLAVVRRRRARDAVARVRRRCTRRWS